MLSSILSQFGYSERESRIYLALLELGPAPASTVARYVGDNRVTVYSVLKLLVKDGIVSESKNGSTQYYFGMDPVRLVERERERYERLQSALPELLSLINVRSHRPKVRFYE